MKESPIVQQSGQSSPVGSQYHQSDMSPIDTRLLSCIAQEGSESPWYMQNGGKEGDLTPT